jgi:hypothetical protein
MSMLHRSFQFVDFELSVKSEAPVSVCSEHLLCRPELPQGMRVDLCAIDTIAIDCVNGSQFTVLLEILTADAGKWEMNIDCGEALDAMTFRSRAGDIASIGMRDPDWMAQKYPLGILDIHRSDRSLGATYEAKTSTTPIIQVAVAWTMNPSTDQEALSAWFAVDKALNF